MKLPNLIDNCQHILLRCCVNLLDFYQRLGVRDRIRFYREFYFIEPGGRISVLRRGALPAPLHFTGSFLRLRCPGRGATKLAIARGLLALRRERTRRDDLDRITMLDWLREKRQTPRAIDRFWRQVLVSAINEDLDRMAARHGFQVFWLGFLARADAYEMGVPAVPLANCMERKPGKRPGDVCACICARRWSASMRTASWPAARAAHGRLLYLRAAFRTSAGAGPARACLRAFAHHRRFTCGSTATSPRCRTPRCSTAPCNGCSTRSEGRYLQLVVSASRDADETISRAEIIELALGELRRIFPARAGGARW